MTLNEYLKQQLYPLELNINFIITDAKTHKEIFSTNEYLNKYVSIPENLFDKTINNVKMKLKACRNIIFAQQPSGCGIPISVLIMNKLFTVSNDPNNETDIYTLITISKDNTIKEHTYNTINELVINNPNIIVKGMTVAQLKAFKTAFEKQRAEIIPIAPQLYTEKKSTKSDINGQYHI